MAKSKKIESYTKAYKELKEITDSMESQDVNIDDLEKMLLRAKELIFYCKEKLRNTEIKINEIISED